MTTLANVRLKVTYGTRVLGIGTSYFIDASRVPLVMDRRGAKFMFAAEVVVAEVNQAAFEAACSALEASFDEAASPALALRIETDSVLYKQLDPAGACYFTILDYADIAGKVFTITVNGTDYILTEGTDFNAITSNAVTAQALAAAINGTTDLEDLVLAATFASAADDDARVFIQSRDPSTYSIEIETDAGGTKALASSLGPTGFNARPSIRKGSGGKLDTALSRRYVIEIAMDLPATATGKDGRLEEKVSIRETDSRQKILTISGAYTALTTKTALEQYDDSLDDFAEDIETALGGDWEGPFDVVAEPDLRYAFDTTDGGRKLGRVVRFSRTYQELIYPRSLGDDVRLRRASLEVSPATEAPGDYGPGGQAVFRMRAITVRYAAAVDKTATQDLKSVYRTVVRPFLESEARKVIDGEQVALVSQRPVLDRAKNRIACELEFLAAMGKIVESTVATQDEDEAGKQLVAVWDGDDYSKQEYQGPKTLRRTVTQTYTSLSGPSGVSGAAGGTQKPASDAFGIFAINGPRSFITITETSAQEAAIDDFFGIPTASAKKDSDTAFPISGGVPEPKGFDRVFRNGVINIKPLVLGRPGDPQITITIVTKVKAYEYIHRPKLPGGNPGPTRTPSPGAGNPGPKIATGPKDGRA